MGAWLQVVGVFVTQDVFVTYFSSVNAPWLSHAIELSSFIAIIGIFSERTS
jgi:hypothetical protein